MTQTSTKSDAHLQWWREARFGIFIHWGIYSMPAGTWNGRRIPGLGEWIMHNARISVDDYVSLAGQFDPVEFNADSWAETIRQSGARYVVMSAKHHDGFAMFASKVDRRNIYDASHCRLDPIGDMAAACRRHGLRFGIAYSQGRDWLQPGGSPVDEKWDPAQAGDFSAYIRKIAAPHIREIVAKYHPAIIWWDAPEMLSPDDAGVLTDAIKADRSIVTNNRLGGGVAGDYDSLEQFAPASPSQGRDWETALTMNETWGYKSHDGRYRTSAELVRSLIDIAGKGGNLLLNIGPTEDGDIPEPQKERLATIGAWMRSNGEAIYGCAEGPYRRLHFDGSVTCNGDKLYLHVYNWPERGLRLCGLATPVICAKVLATGQKLTISKEPDGSRQIARPDELDPIATVIEVKLAGQAVIGPAAYEIEAMENAEIVLGAIDAVPDSPRVRMEGPRGTESLGFWSEGALRWTVRLPDSAAGVYRAQMEYACEPGSGGCQFGISVNDAPASVGGTVAETGSWHLYRTVQIDGEIELAAGLSRISIEPISRPRTGVMNLRSIRLHRC